MLCERCQQDERNPGERFCKECRKAVLAEIDKQLTPRVFGRHRSADQMQERSHDPNPWSENAVRALED